MVWAQAWARGGTPSATGDPQLGALEIQVATGRVVEPALRQGHPTPRTALAAAGMPSSASGNGIAGSSRSSS